MSKYKVGDRVRITSFMTYDYGNLIGMTGTVTDRMGYGSVVRVDRPVKVHGDYSDQTHTLLLLLDKELEYEDNKRNAITLDLLAKSGDIVFTKQMYQCDGATHWFHVGTTYRQGDLVVNAECPRCIIDSRVVIPISDIDHISYYCDQPNLRPPFIPDYLMYGPTGA